MDSVAELIAMQSQDGRALRSRHRRPRANSGDGLV
jgi:hypothetical protein